MMRRFGLIGYPLGHSFSKKYFGEKFISQNIKDCAYENYPLQSVAELPALIKNDPEICGLNVTIPYKSDVIPFLSHIDNEASAIGAVNVIKISRRCDEIILSGFNSDITGIEATLRDVLPRAGKHAIVLGTGGSSKAVRYVLKKHSINVTLVSRETKEGCITYSDLSESIIAENLLIINTTPLGMFPKTEGYPDIKYNSLGKDHILFDLVYNPEETLFLRKGKERGCTTLSGIYMLHSQAERAWEIWNDEKIM